MVRSLRAWRGALQNSQELLISKQSNTNNFVLCIFWEYPLMSYFWNWKGGESGAQQYFSCWLRKVLQGVDQSMNQTLYFKNCDCVISLNMLRGTNNKLFPCQAKICQGVSDAPQPLQQRGTDWHCVVGPLTLAAVGWLWMWSVAGNANAEIFRNEALERTCLLKPDHCCEVHCEWA